MALLLLLALRSVGVKRRLPVVLTFFLAALAVQSLLLTSTVRRFEALPPVTYAAKDAFLLNSLDYYGAAKALNGSAQKGARVYLLHTEGARFYVDNDAYGDWYGRYNYAWLESGATSVEDLVARWRSAGFRYVLADEAVCRAALKGRDALIAGLTDYARSHQVFAHGRFVVFRVD